MNINTLACLSLCKSHAPKKKKKGLINDLYFAVCQWWNSATNAAASSQTCCKTVVLMGELGNTKNSQPSQHFLHIYTLQIFIFLRWQRTYGESTFSCLCANHSFFIFFCQFSWNSMFYIVTADSKWVSLVWCLWICQNRTNSYIYFTPALSLDK